MTRNAKRNAKRETRNAKRETRNAKLIIGHMYKPPGKACSVHLERVF